MFDALIRIGGRTWLGNVAARVERGDHSTRAYSVAMPDGSFLPTGTKVKVLHASAHILALLREADVVLVDELDEDRDQRLAAERAEAEQRRADARSRLAAAQGELREFGEVA